MAEHVRFDLFDPPGVSGRDALKRCTKGGICSPSRMPRRPTRAITGGAGDLQRRP